MTRPARSTKEWSMKKLLPGFVAILLLALNSVGAPAPAPDPAKATRVKVGDLAPQFEVTTLDGARFSLKEHRGEVVLINFFATWCGPCLEEMPHLEKEIWQRHKSAKLAMIALGREHTNSELIPFRKKHQLTFPMAGDVKREIFDKYAEAYIPRSLLIDVNGRVIAQVVGYNEKEFRAFVETLEKALAKTK